MQDDVERVARAYASVMGFSFDKQMPDQQELLLKGTAAAMAATREIDAEALRVAIKHAGAAQEEVLAGAMEGVADWLQQRANDVKEAGNG